ncbi:MAG TPA: helix-turn-helix domain-containing protein [Opitutaceae bacterium]|nr:helix-turn-helix domain-containing protein [Opitutaceae bacterium]
MQVKTEAHGVPSRKDNRRSDCPIANALDLLGDRWSLLIVRDLTFRGFREFGQFLAADEGISTNILAERLERLCCAGLLVRTNHPSDGKKYRYLLTEKGMDLIPVLIQLALWGAKYTPDHAAPEAVLRQMRAEPERLAAGLRAALLVELRQAGA